MKTIYKVSLMAIPGLCFLCLNTTAQDNLGEKKDSTVTKKYKPFDVNLQLRSLYIWRGFKVSNAPISNADMHYITRDGSFAAGVWGGAGFTGDYKEFDYYISYAKKGFNIAVWDINNFTGFPNADLFKYDRETTSHFIDVTVGYQFKSKFPLSINWSTIVQGRDTYIKSDGEVANAFSNYVVMDYRLWKEGSAEMHVFAGGGFAFGRDENFYGSKPNIVNTGITINKDLVVFNYHVPVAATAMFSPEHRHGALQLVVTPF